MNRDQIHVDADERTVRDMEEQLRFRGFIVDDTYISTWSESEQTKKDWEEMIKRTNPPFWFLIRMHDKEIDKMRKEERRTLGDVRWIAYASRSFLPNQLSFAAECIGARTFQFVNLTNESLWKAVRGEHPRIIFYMAFQVGEILFLGIDAVKFALAGGAIEGSTTTKLYGHYGKERSVD